MKIYSIFVDVEGGIRGVYICYPLLADCCPPRGKPAMHKIQRSTIQV